jgi:acid phosphatase (class A)
MKLFLALFFSLNLLACSTQTTAPVAQPTTPVEEQKFVSVDSRLASEIQTQIPAFPKKGSAAQKADEAELRKLQKTRTAEDCARANSEVVVTLQSLYGKPYGELTEQQVATLAPFFDKIRNELGGYIGIAKKGYARLRPYLYVKGLKPCVPTETSFAYPSGHATLGMFYGLILTDIFPAKEAQFKARTETIGRDRILGGVHHPTDVQAGYQLGRMLYTELAKSKLYQQEVETYRESLK